MAPLHVSVTGKSKDSSQTDKITIIEENGSSLQYNITILDVAIPFTYFPVEQISDSLQYVFKDQNDESISLFKSKLRSFLLN